LAKITKKIESLLTTIRIICVEGREYEFDTELSFHDWIALMLDDEFEWVYINQAGSMAINKNMIISIQELLHNKERDGKVK
jgi:hypothetical protein